MSTITSHILDTTVGRPAEGVSVLLENETAPQTWVPVGDAVSDAEGRVANMVPASLTLRAGKYRLSFDTGPYYAAKNLRAFYPEVYVIFHVHDPEQHYHLPLLISRFGYTTYRGT
jgi:5-hydroxyisourate hydrolase